MKNEAELLTLNQIHEEYPALPVSTLQKSYREKKLIGIKIGRSIKVSRKNLNKYLGIETTDQLLEKDLEIARLKNQLEGYKRQYATLKQLMSTMQGVINVL